MVYERLLLFIKLIGGDSELKSPMDLFPELRHNVGVNLDELSPDSLFSIR